MKHWSEGKGKLEKMLRNTHLLEKYSNLLNRLTKDQIFFFWIELAKYIQQLQ